MGANCYLQLANAFEIMQKGDIIRIKRKHFYWHYGIYLGLNQVIHYSCHPSSIYKVKASVKICDLSEFCNKSSKFEVYKSHEDSEIRKLAVRKALKRLGEEKYSLIYNNCKHFVRDCIHPLDI